MKVQSLKRITKSLEAVLAELGAASLRDRGVRHRYAEFLVASVLAERGHVVQVLGERDDTSADIYLPHIRKRVEVKSCKAHDNDGEVDWADASFGQGNQIKDKQVSVLTFYTPPPVPPTL